MARRASRQRTVWQRIWRFLTSRTVAVVLFLATLAVLSFSLWLPQLPADLDPAGQTAWWAALQQRHGSSLDLFRPMGLLQVDRAPLFLALLAALLLNTLACTLDRLAALWRSLTCRLAMRLPEPAYELADWEAQGVTLEQARRILRRQRLHLREAAAGAHYFHGVSGRLVPLGTILTHLGLFLLALAALLHSTLAWRDGLVLDAGAAPVALRQRPDCTVQSAGVTPSATALAPEGSLIVQEGGNAVQGWIGPARPLAACGATWYASSCGLILRIEAHDGSGQPLLVALGEGQVLRFTEGVASGSFDIPALGLHGTVTPALESPVSSPGTLADLRLEQAGRPVYQGPLVPEEQQPGHTQVLIDVPGGRLAFYPDSFLAVEAVHDPGLVPFLVAGLALTGGSALSLLWPRRRLWARWSAAGTLQVRLGNRGPAELAGALAALELGAERVTGGQP